MKPLALGCKYHVAWNNSVPSDAIRVMSMRFKNLALEERRMRISNEGILVILFVGVIAGWLAGKVVRGTGFGLIGDLVVGVAGALLASLLFPRLGIAIGSGLVSEIIYSAIGAIILLLIVRLVRTGGRF
jgi:uncharacterized membrane protein YeaQ/YmgE (transglycosylase-associated protein family)